MVLDRILKLDHFQKINLWSSCPRFAASRAKCGRRPPRARPIYDRREDHVTLNELVKIVI